MKKQKLLQRVLAGSTKNIGFGEMVALVEAFGFDYLALPEAITSLHTPKLLNWSTCKKSAGWRSHTRFASS